MRTAMTNKYKNASIVDILEGCVDQDDEQAWLALWPIIERIGQPYIRRLTDHSKGVDGEDFPNWLYGELFRRRVSARRREVQTDTMYYLLNSIRENETPAEEQEAELGRRLGDLINRSLGAEFVRRERRGIREVVPPEPLGGDEPPTPPTSTPAGVPGRFDYDDPAELVEQLAAEAGPDHAPMVYLRLFHHVGELPDFVVEHVMTVQRELDEPVISLDTGDDAAALRAFLMDQEADLDDFIRWEPLALLLNVTRGALMARWCRLMQRVRNEGGKLSDA